MNKTHELKKLVVKQFFASPETFSKIELPPFCTNAFNFIFSFEFNYILLPLERYGSSNFFKETSDNMSQNLRVQLHIPRGSLMDQILF